MSSSGELKLLFESLHKQYQPMVLQMCLGFMKGDDDLAKDLAQEVFINIWNSLSKFKGNSSYKTWVYRITVNTCLLHIRANKNKTSVALSEAPVPTVMQESVQKDGQEYQELYTAIGQLAELDRLIIMLVLEELDYEEISNIIGINAVNLRVKIHRIKNKIRKYLNKEETHG